MEEQKNTSLIIDKTLEFFDNFYLKDGFEVFRTEFFIENYRDEEGNWQTYNHAKRHMLVEDEFVTIKTVDYVKLSPDTEDYLEEFYYYKEYFKNKLKEQLNIQVDVFKRRITERIVLLDLNESKIATLLKTVITDIGYLASKVEFSDALSRYPINLKILFELIAFIGKRYSTFLQHSEYPILKEAEVFLLKSQEEEIELEVPKITAGVGSDKKVDVKALTWLKSPEQNTELLYELLTWKGIIPKNKDVFDKFELTFSGKVLETPLNIEWLLTKGAYIKPPVVRIFKYLLMDDLGLISPMSNSDLAASLNNIFVDKDGIPSKNWINGLSKSKSNAISKKITDLNEIDLHNTIRNASFIK
jgi:hypothetical protein